VAYPKIVEQFEMAKLEKQKSKGKIKAKGI